MEGVASARCIPIPVVSLFFVCICMHLFYFLSLLNLYYWCVSVSDDSGKVDLPTAFFLFSLNVVVLMSPPLTKYFQWCLDNVAHSFFLSFLCAFFNPRHSTQVRHHTHIDMLHVVSVLLNIWWSAPRYSIIPILIWQHDVPVLLNIWW